MPVYQSSDFGSVSGKVFAGGIQLLQTSPSSDGGSFTVYVSATVNDHTCVLQELDLLTLNVKGIKFTLENETCEALLPGIVSSQTHTVRSLVVLGSQVEDGRGKVAVYHLEGDFFSGFTSGETMRTDNPWTYPIDVSYSKDFKATDFLFYAPAEGATDSVHYPSKWTPFVAAPPKASALEIAQIHAKNYGKIVWRQRHTAYDALDPTKPVPVMPAGLYTHPETEAVYVAGSTSGVGEAFGEVSGTTTDVDGFILKLDANLAMSSSRLGTAGDDYIISQCSPVEETALMEGDKFQINDPDSDLADAWYIVGATSSSFFKPTQAYVQGDGNTPVYRAFISRIDLETMLEEWTIELTAPVGTPGANATATKCVVDPATGDIYVSGTTTTLLEAENEFGLQGLRGNEDGADRGLFLTRIDEDGVVKWVQHFGSGHQSDRVTSLALVPSDSIASSSPIKDAAQVLVAGHTSGNIAGNGPDPSTTELFVAAVDAMTGTMLLNDESVPAAALPTDAPTSHPMDAPTSYPVDLPQSPVDEPTIPPELPSASFSDSYLGCWIDKVEDRAMDIEGHGNGIEECVAFCRDYKSEGHGYPYAGLQYGNECYCGFQYDKHGDVRDEECDQPCVKGGGMCGGLYRSSVYSTGATIPTQSPTQVPVNAPTILSEPDPSPQPTEEPVDEPTGAPQQDPTVSLTRLFDPDPTSPREIETYPPITSTQQEAHTDATITRDGSAFQSNWGPSYAGAMVYDFTRHAIYLTGSTCVDPEKQLSTCFLGHLPLSNLQHWKTVPDPVSTGEGYAIEKSGNMACRSLDRDEDYLWVGGMFEDRPTERNSQQQGLYTLYKRDHRNPDWDVLHADLLKQNPDQVKVQLPEAMVVLPNENKVFIASVASNDDQLTPEYYKSEGKEECPNLTAGADYLKRGYGYYTTIQAYKIQNGRYGPYPSFDQSIELQTDKDVFVTGMSLMEEKKQIIIGGNVKGKNARNFNVERTADDMDGFVLQMELTRLMTGEAIRFNSIENADDFVHNVCESPDGVSYFVVGSTSGTMPNARMYETRQSSGSLSAFVAKVDFESKDIVWTTQFNAKEGAKGVPGDAKAEAFGCHVISHDDTTIYVGGVVYDGASMSKNLKSAGSDDLFVSQIDTYDGSVRWMKQIGSSGKENMARNNGVFADMEGDCLLYGDTTGELYRTRPDKSTTSDIFIVKLSQNDGSYSETLEIRRAHLALIGMGVLLLLTCCGCCFCAVGGPWFRRRRAPSKKNDDYDNNDAIFRDDPSVENGNGHNGILPYSDESGDENGAARRKGIVEMPMVSSSKQY